MTYYPDMSPYEYRHSGVAENTVNIGWLDPTYDYPRGDENELLLQKLWNFCRVSVVQTRGFHLCQFCWLPRRKIPTIKRDGEVLEVGAAEIRVFGQNEMIYAAPNLIYHYIEKHSYYPPQKFIQAVLNGPQPGTSRYQDLLCQYDWC